MKDLTGHTKQEKKYLDTIGKWKLKTYPQQKDLKRGCLIGYRDSIKKRVVWDGIDRKEIIAHLNRILIYFGIPIYSEEENAATRQPGDSSPDSL